MKVFIIIILQILIYGIECQNERKWMEIGRELYLIEPKAEYKWDEAVKECQRERSTLISAKGDYDYARLKNAIQMNFKNHAPFWTDSQVKSTNVFNELGLGKQKNNRKKCNKFNNSSDFKFIPEDCDKPMGFICEKTLLNEFTSFYDNHKIYLVQPEQKYTCEHAYAECDRRNMLMLPFVDFANYSLLKNYIFINYGSTPSFWFGFNNETHDSCVSPNRGQPIYADSKLGFICYQKYSNEDNLAARHWILFMFVVFAFIAAIMFYIITRFCCVKKLDNYYSSETLYYPEEVKVKDFK